MGLVLAAKQPWDWKAPNHQISGRIVHLPPRYSSAVFPAAWRAPTCFSSPFLRFQLRAGCVTGDADGRWRSWRVHVPWQNQPITPRSLNLTLLIIKTVKYSTLWFCVVLRSFCTSLWSSTSLFTSFNSLSYLFGYVDFGHLKTSSVD